LPLAAVDFALLFFRRSRSLSNKGCGKTPVLYQGIALAMP
jgi:hypothetical protein